MEENLIFGLFLVILLAGECRSEFETCIKILALKVLRSIVTK